jgi:putative membrane protein
MHSRDLLVIAALLGGASYAIAQPAGAPNDAQIADIAYTAGVIDIAAAHQALEKSHNPAVRDFARETVRDHTAVNVQALALVHKLHVTPEPNSTSTSLTQAAGQKRHDYAHLYGHAFDLAYAKNEVAYHQTVNSALANTLIPDAHNPELKSLLQTGLKLFQMHEQHAEEMVAALSK